MGRALVCRLNGYNGFRCYSRGLPDSDRIAEVFVKNIEDEDEMEEAFKKQGVINLEMREVMDLKEEAAFFHEPVATTRPGGR